MKEFNKILYDILLKIEFNETNNKQFKLNFNLIKKYFNQFEDQKNSEFIELESYFLSFFDYCFDLPLDKMIKKAISFKY